MDPELDLLRSYEALIDDVQKGERSVVAKINTAVLDRFKTVIDPLGANLESYNKARVVLWEHGQDPMRGMLPVGRNLWIRARKAEKDLIAKTVFGDDEFSQALFGMYQDGTLRSFSIRPLPDFSKCSPPTAAEVRSRPELADCKMMYRAWELLEYSAVAIPGNPEALALAVSRGLWVPDRVRSILPSATAPPPAVELPPFPQRPELPPLVGRRLTDVIDSRRSAIQAQGDLIRARLDLRRGIV